MPHDGPSSERALARLRQLAREEALAVDAGDVEGLCRAAALLPFAMQAYADSHPRLDEEARRTIADILQAHDRAREFLEARLDELAFRLQQLASARRLQHSARPSRSACAGVLDSLG